MWTSQWTPVYSTFTTFNLSLNLINHDQKPADNPILVKHITNDIIKTYLPSILIVNSSITFEAQCSPSGCTGNKKHPPWVASTIQRCGRCAGYTHPQIPETIADKKRQILFIPGADYEFHWVLIFLHLSNNSVTVKWGQSCVENFWIFTDYHKS